MSDLAEAANASLDDTLYDDTPDYTNDVPINDIGM